MPPSVPARAPARHRVETVAAGGLPAVALHDDAEDLHAVWVPAAGMLGASLVHRGAELLWTGAGAGAYAQWRAFMGVPFLHPWANRLGGWHYAAGGRTVALDPASPLLLLDEHGLPIHGLLTASPAWQVRDASAGHGGARLRAVLDFDHPGLLAAFPFRHRIELEVVVTGGRLEVHATLEAVGGDPVPVAFGFHPYLRLPGVPRAAWEVTLPVRRRLVLDERLLPTGAVEATEPITGPIGGRTWDDSFDRLDRPARFVVRGGGRSVTVGPGPRYEVVRVFAPPDEEYICLEPMSAPTDALRATPESLTWVPPGERHHAVFAIEPRSEA